MYLCLNPRYWENGSDCVPVTCLCFLTVVWQWRFSSTTQVPLHQLNGIQQTVQCLSRLGQIIKSLCGTWQWRETTKQKGKDGIWMFLRNYCSFTWYANVMCLRIFLYTWTLPQLEWFKFCTYRGLKGVDDGLRVDLGGRLQGCKS